MTKFIQTSFTLWASIFLLSACVPRQYEKNESSLIIIKTPILKFADLGYVRKDNERVRVDLFTAGQPVQSIEINRLVCVDEGCLSKSAFNQDYLHPSYPDDLILNVLLARPIFEKASLQVTPTGFIQNLKSTQYNITYKIDNGNIYFKDRQNNLMIKISKTKG